MTNCLTLLVVLILAMSVGRHEATETWARDSIAAPQIAAKRDEPKQSFRDCGECPEIVSIPAGEFMMGSDPTEPGRAEREGPQRRVRIRQFAAGKFDVTRGQWAAFASATNRITNEGCFWTARSGSKTDPIGSWRNTGFPKKPGRQSCR